MTSPDTGPGPGASGVPILERDEQLARLGALARSACAGSGCAVAVEGSAGIGKTRLLAAARAQARSLGMEVLAAQGSEPERDFAFGVVRQLFEDRVRTASARERRALLTGAASTVRPLLGGQDAGAESPAAGDRFAVVHGLYWLCANLAARAPLMLVVDDVHWADEPSLRWLHFLCSRIEGLPILAVMATRTDEPLTQSQLLGEVLLDPRNHRMRLAPLSEAAVSSIVRSRLGESCAREFCHACHATSGGNPFYLEELLHALDAHRVGPNAQSAAPVLAQGPRSIGDTILARLDRLGGGAPALARALAVLGPGAGLRVAATLAGLDPGTAARAADALAAMQILDPAGTLEFVHPIVRSAIYSGIPHWERALQHRRAAALLDGHDRLEAVAAQLLASEPAGEAWSVQILRSAAREALGRGAPESAVGYLRRALEEPPPPDQQPVVLREAGHAAFLSGDALGRDYLRQALDQSREAATKAEIALELGQVLVVADQLRDAVDVLQTGIDQAVDDPELVMALEAQLMAATMMWPPALEQVARWSRADIPDSPAGRLLVANLAIWGFVSGLHAAKVRELAERALGGDRLLTERTAGVQYFYLAVNALYAADWLELGERSLDRAVDQARTQGSLAGFALASCWRSDAAFRAGRLADAEADAFASLRAAGTAEWWGLAPAVIAHLLQVLIERGELEAAAALLRDHPIDAADVDSVLRNIWRFQRGRLVMAQGRVQDGVDDILATGAWLWRAGWRNPSAWPWRSQAALGLATLGRLDEARRLAWEEIELARPLGQPRTLGMALRAAGLVESGERGLELLQQAVAVLADGPSPLEHARALVGLGRAHRHRGHRNDARPALSEGLDLAHRCGATVLVQSAQDELRLSGARPRRLRTTGLMALTAAERHVAQMAAEGLSNAEIGQSQFIGLKTVETHLSRVYSKLGITSRSALPAALARPLDE